MEIDSLIVPRENAFEVWKQVRSVFDETGLWPLITGGVGPTRLTDPPEEDRHRAFMKDWLERTPLMFGRFTSTETMFEYLREVKASEDLARYEKLKELNAPQILLDHFSKGGWPYRVKEQERPWRADVSARKSPQSTQARSEDDREREILLIETGHAWELPLRLALGGWNRSPLAQFHAGAWHIWGRAYGAEPVVYNEDLIEFRVARPPSTREQARSLAYEHFWYTPHSGVPAPEQGDVHSGIAGRAAQILDSPFWHFWWD